VIEYHSITARDMNNSFITGFDISTNNGPLCEEPMLGAVFIVDLIELVNQAENE
jgi:hypothetical protein